MVSLGISTVAVLMSGFAVRTARKILEEARAERHAYERREATTTSGGDHG